MSAAYSILDYGLMIAADERTRVYVSALERHVKRDSIVVDIGTGTGFFAIVAAKLGARHVYAIEPDDSIAIAEEAAALNGVADRITFIQDMSDRIELPERADVIISDLGGVLPAYGGHFHSIIDARERLLKPDGVLIRRRDTLWAAPVAVPEFYDSLTSVWSNEVHGVDLSIGRRYITSAWHRCRLQPSHLVAPAAIWCEIDYRELDTTTVSGSASWTVEKAEAGHGFAAWFNGEADEGLVLRSGPGDPKHLYAQMLIPWPEAVDLEPGDGIRLRMSAHPVNDTTVWRWRTWIDRAHRGAPELSFDQNTLQSVPVAKASLACKESEHIPEISASGEADRWMLSAFDGQTSLGEIAAGAYERFSTIFENEGAALTRASQLAERDGRR